MDYTKLDPEALMAFAPLFARMDKVRTAHGVIMPLTIVVWFPLGVFLLRFLNMKNKVLWHAVWQGFGLALLVTGFGLGRWLSKKAGVSSTSPSYLRPISRGTDSLVALQRRSYNTWNRHNLTLYPDAHHRLVASPTLCGEGKSGLQATHTCLGRSPSSSAWLHQWDNRPQAVEEQELGIHCLWSGCGAFWGCVRWRLVLEDC